MSLNKKKFQPGEYLFREGDQTYFFYLIDEGQVEVLKNGPDGKEMFLAYVGPSNPVGEFAMIDRKPRSASVRAKTVVTASLISEADYKLILADLPPWATSMMNSYVERLRNIDQVLVKNGLDSKLRAQIEDKTHKK